MTPLRLEPVLRYEYQLKAWLKTILFLLVVGGFIFSAAVVFINLHGPVTVDPISLFLLLFVPALAGAYCLGTALRSRLLIYGTHIEVRSLMQEQVTDVSELTGYRTVSTRNGSYWKLIRKNGQRAITVTQSFDSDDHLRAWFTQLTDLDERDRKELLEKIEQNSELGATPEERLASLKQAKIWNIALSASAVAAFLGSIFERDSLGILCACVLAIVPLTVLYLVSTQPLLYALFKSKRDPRSEMSLEFLLGAMGLILVNGNNHLVSFGPLLPYMAVVAAVCFFAMLSAVRNSSQVTGALLGGILFAGGYGYGLVASCNELLDHSPVTMYEAEVTGKHISSGRSTTYYLELDPWGPEETRNSLSVSSGVYSRTDVGDTVCLALRNGTMHAPWYRQVKCDISPAN